MSEHRGSRSAAPRRGRVRRRPGDLSTRVRAFLALGVVLGVGAVGTFASWSDSAAIQTGAFTAGRLDLKLDATNDGNPTAYAKTSLALADLVPGESFAGSFTVDNKGTIPFTYAATAAAAIPAGNTYGLLGELTVQVYVGGTASNATSANGTRTGSCTGGTAMTATAVSAMPATAVTTRPALAVSGSTTLCVLATLPASAATSSQGKGAVVTFTVNADQVTG